MKKIISTALTVIMLLTCMIAVIPVNAFAAMSSSESESEEVSLTTDEVRNYFYNSF